VVECQLPKLDVAGSIPVSRSRSPQVNPKTLPLITLIHTDQRLNTIIFEFVIRVICIYPSSVFIRGEVCFVQKL
jgi:hypothetical protein